ncbi:MAG: HD domain-containing protein [Elusimicrobiota bacterium]|nr:HD domain-containing protein [Endomicrobiia bacterium]MDW8166230.1 HD domain-containing protein [Elusimicrobiota bacterium]
MKLSDILKKIQQTQNQSQKIDLPETSKETSDEKFIQQQSLDFDKIYADSINIIKNLFKELSSQKQSIYIDDVVSASKNIIKAIYQDINKMLLYSCYSTFESYIYAHSVNVGIYSAVIGISKNLNEQELEELTLCALLHDIGMNDYLNIAHKPYKLTEPEFEEIKKHSEIIKKYIETFQISYSLKQKILLVVSQVHERCNASGYPKKLKCEEIDLFAKIISIADVYEAMTHPRPYRERILPHDAIVSLVKQAQTELDSQLVKLFVDKISIFPVGSYVKLNTGEIARVIAANPSFPVRPKVKIILTSEKLPPKQTEIINLAEVSSINIVEAVDETKIDTTDKKLILQLKAQRWWVR